MLKWGVMAMMDVNKLKVGVFFFDAGQPWQVLKSSFTKLGRGKANIKVRIKNLLTKAIVDKSYLSGNRVEQLNLNKKQLQFLYKDLEGLHFMDPVSFEQYEVDKKILGDEAKYLVEEEKVWILFWEERPIGVEIPASVVMKVKEVEAAEKGNSATNVLKRAKMENGLAVQVPMFIRVEDRIKINTSTGEYVGRVN